MAKIKPSIITATENEPVCAAFLRALVTRGLRTDQGLPCVIDGAQRPRKVIQTVFRRQAVGQRHQWQKRENVVRDLPKGLSPRGGGGGSRRLSGRPLRKPWQPCSFVSRVLRRLMG